MADAGSFGVKVHFSSEKPVPTVVLINDMEEVLLRTGKRIVIQHGSLIGHVKAFVKTGSGSIRMNLIDVELGVDASNDVSEESIKNGDMNFMAAAIGVPDHDLEEIMEDCLQLLKKDFKIELEEHGHGHDADHAHVH